MKVGLLTAAWKRYDILEIYCKAVTRYRKHPDIKLIPIVVVSEKETYKICRKYKIKTVRADNFPLSNKFQKGLSELKKSRPDYVINVGSDDIFCNGTIDAYLEQMKHGIDFISLSSCYFYNRLTGELTYWNGYKNHRRGESAGVGRCLSSNLLDKINWKAWDCHINKGLDSCMTKTLSKHEYSRASLNCLQNDIFVVDLKDKQSVTQLKHFPKLPRVKLSFLKHYLPNECQAITDTKYRENI